MASKIFATGDAAIDWFEVIAKPRVGSENNGHDNWERCPSVRRIPMPGGSLMLTEMLRKAARQEVTGPKLLERLEMITPEQMVHSEVTLSCEDKTERYSIVQEKGYAGPPVGQKPLCLNAANNFIEFPIDAGGAEIIVIDDAGNGFRNCVHLFPQDISKDALLIYKVHSPLMTGSLWQWIKRSIDPEKIVVVTNIDDIRKVTEVSIRSGLSWESTACDFIFQIRRQARLAELADCSNLVVTIDTDGAILYEGGEQGVCTLLYDARRLEGGFRRETPIKIMGTTQGFTALLVSTLCANGIGFLKEGVKRGLAGMRLLLQGGYAVTQDEVSLRNMSFEKVDGSFMYHEVEVPVRYNLNNPDPGYWQILDQKTANTAENIAENYFRTGKDRTLDSVPEIQFGKKLKTIDRMEIESYSAIQRLIREYLDSHKPEHPLCIAVFGAPGSGKSFTVDEIAKTISEGKIEKRTYNISQIPDEKGRDLARAFHTTRDIALSGKVPLVFFDEFDTEGKKWLKYFLSPMQDGKFVDEGSEYNIGKAIFVFAGGTSTTFEQFADGQDTPDGKALKLPDFISRLRGFVNIMGPNRRDNNVRQEGDLHSGIDDDPTYIIRRAKMLRLMVELTDSARGLFDAERKLSIDQSVLRALLKVPEYRHGCRSIKAILQMSRLANQKAFVNALLPPKEQLDLHVDADAFMFLLEKERFTDNPKREQEIVSALAKDLHASYIRHRKIEGNKYSAAEDFNDLSEDMKRSNMDAAEDIPAKMRHIGLNIRRVKAGCRPSTPLITGQEIEELAEKEHERYCRERRLQGWTYGKERNDLLKKTALLVAYKDLPDDKKEYDREAVIDVPLVLAKNGFELFRAQEKVEIGDRKMILELAKVIHEDYLSQCRKKGDTKKNNPAMVSFDELSEDLKLSNIDNAANLPVKLLAIGYEIRKSKTGQVAAPIDFTEDEIEKMARLEHTRWCWERRLQGWVYGKKKDPAKKTTPVLVMYDSLPEREKEKDRETVRLIPQLLKSIGYEAYRL